MTFLDSGSGLASSLGALVRQASLGQQQPGPNDPGGPPPDPRSLPVPTQINPAKASFTPQLPARNPTGPPGRDQTMQDQTAAGETPGWWRSEEQQPSQYIPAQPNRGFGRWGTPWWPIEAAMSVPNMVASPYMPSPMEAYGVMRGAGGQLGQWASPSVAQPAARAGSFAMSFAPILDLLSGGKFSHNFNAARLGTLKIQQEQMLIDAEQAAQNHTREMLAFGSVFKEAELGAISADDARHRIRNLAIQTGHRNLIEILNTKDLAGVEKYLDWEDAKMRDLQAATHSLRRATGTSSESDAQLAEEWGKGPSTGGGGLGSTPLPEKPGYSQQAQATPPQAPDAQAGDFVDGLKKQLGLSDEQADAARDLAAGGNGGAAYDKLRKNKSRAAQELAAPINRAADAMKARLDQRLHDPNMSREDKLHELSQISPEKADLVRGLLDYGADSDKLPAAHGERERLMGYALAINPRWKAGNFKIVQKYHDANTSEGLRVQRVSSLDSAFWSLNSVVGHMSETDKIPTNVMRQWLAGHYSGDPKWDELYSAIRGIAIDTIAIQTGSGRPALNLVRDMVKHMLTTNSPASIRAQALVDARGAYGQIVTLRQQFRDEVGDPHAQLPFFNPDVGEKFQAWLRMNPYTGQIPEDAPSSIRGVGKSTDQKNLPSWIRRTTPEHPGQELAPLTKDQIRQGWDKLDELNRLGTPEARAQAQWLRERLGIFADRGTLD